MKTINLLKGQSRYGNATHLGLIDEFFAEPHEVQNAEGDIQNPGKVDEGLWEKAKRASEHALGETKYAFVTWWYKKHGGHFG